MMILPYTGKDSFQTSFKEFFRFSFVAIKTIGSSYQPPFLSVSGEYFKLDGNMFFNERRSQM